MGKRVYDFLQDKRSIEVDGCSTCWQQCDVSHERTPESWWYTPTKNKQKLRSRCVFCWVARAVLECVCVCR